MTEDCGKNEEEYQLGFHSCSAEQGAFKRRERRNIYEDEALGITKKEHKQIAGKVGRQNGRGLEKQQAASLKPVLFQQ